jgi:hypothetical protein
MSMHLAALQFLDISQYSEQPRKHDKLLLCANLRQNNVLVDLNAVSDQDFHSEQLPTPHGPLGVPTLFILGRCQWGGLGGWKVLW